MDNIPEEIHKIITDIKDLFDKVFALEKRQDITEERQKHANKALENMEKDFKEFTSKTFIEFQREQRENNKQTNKILYIGMGILTTVQVLVIPLLLIFVKG